MEIECASTGEFCTTFLPYLLLREPVTQAQYDARNDGIFTSDSRARQHKLWLSLSSEWPPFPPQSTVVSRRSAKSGT
jgi:hypothetical protein